MKLRLRGNTVRLRLTRSEVARAAAGEEVSERATFAGATLTYVLAPSEGATLLAADLVMAATGATLRVSAPTAMVREWATTDRVGLEVTEPMRVLVEKDFQCLTERAQEEDLDAFPHPPHSRHDRTGKC